MRAPRAARLALSFLTVSAISIGLPATVAPQTFYDDFPFFAQWVNLLPPYNEHLVTDVGGLYLGFAVILGWAAWTLERTLLRAASAGWLLTVTLHFVFHADHLEGYGTADAIAQLTSLALLIGASALALWAAREPGGDGAGSPNGPRP